MANIMIVDDSAIMRKNIRRALELGGHEVVIEASDGRELLPQYINYKPDLVTLDINMNTMDGVDALRILMKPFPEAKVIMISANGQKIQVLEAIKAGAKSYLVKPFEPDKLLETVNKVLNM